MSTWQWDENHFAFYLSENFHGEMFNFLKVLEYFLPLVFQPLL